MTAVYLSSALHLYPVLQLFVHAGDFVAPLNWSATWMDSGIAGHRDWKAALQA